MKGYMQWLGGAVLLAGLANAAQAAYPIAGLSPDRRPEGAPVITHDAHSPAWVNEALRGIPQPYPQSLLFLMNQGNWYTPFTRPGMPGSYDLRGWHGTR
ncbi:MAG: hypothetical protein ACFCUG_16075 [Thiotrichales bacterium]